MILIVGLGNPGKQYERTRHNVGFEAIDQLANRLNVQVTTSKHHALITEAQHQGKRLILMKPQTYMNESGVAVSAAMKWYRLEPQDVIVFSDDIDLAPGCIRLRPFGGAGTHNGWKSILRETGSSAFPRVRIGVGAPPPKWDLADWVLSRYTGTDESAAVLKAIETAAEAAFAILNLGIDAAMNQFNVKKKSESDV